VRPITEARCLPVPGEVTARHRVDDHSSIGGTIAAVYVRGCSTIDWILGGDLSDRGGTTFSARNIPRVYRSVDVETIYQAVTVCGWNEGEGCDKER